MMNNKINCAEQAKKAISSLSERQDLYITEMECKDDWNEDYACFIVHLMEEEYRDYSSLREDVIEKVKNIIEDDSGTVTVLHGLKSGIRTGSGYILHVHHLGCGFTLEFELYKKVS